MDESPEMMARHQMETNFLTWCKMSGVDPNRDSAWIMFHKWRNGLVKAEIKEVKATHKYRNEW